MVTYIGDYTHVQRCCNLFQLSGLLFRSHIAWFAAECGRCWLCDTRNVTAEKQSTKLEQITAPLYMYVYYRKFWNDDMGGYFFHPDHISLCRNKTYWDEERNRGFCGDGWHQCRGNWPGFCAPDNEGNICWPWIIRTFLNCLNCRKCVPGGDVECRTGNGVTGWAGRTGQCGPFGQLFHFLCDILRLHSV